MDSPTNINNLVKDSVLEVVWGDGVTGRIDFHFLREQCSCAHCVHELTGERLLDPSTFPADLHIESMKLVGNYALKIQWSDGHDTGLFSWEKLRQLSRPQA